MRVIKNIYTTSVIFVVTSISIFLSSTIVSAQENPLKQINESLSIFGGIVNTSTIIVVALAFLYFFYHLGMFILRGDSGEEKTDSKKKMGWSLIAIVIITSLWGIIIFIRGVFGIEVGEANNVEVPTVIIRK